MCAKQLILDFKDEKGDLSAVEFVETNESEKVRGFLDRFFSQKLSDDNLVRRAILKGDEKSGKTHLCEIYAKKFNAFVIDRKALKDFGLAGFFKKGGFYVLEDIDKIKDDDLLFHILNLAYENQSFLLMSACDLRGFVLKDLVSRLRNIVDVEIESPPSVKTIEMLLVDGFARRQLKVEKGVVEFLVKNVERSYEGVFGVVDRVERVCFEKGSGVGVGEVRGWFR